jgi:hypothetical protein
VDYITCQDEELVLVSGEKQLLGRNIFKQKNDVKILVLHWRKINLAKGMNQTGKRRRAADQRLI